MEKNIEKTPITDEEIAQNPDMYRDEDGVHLKLKNGDILIEPSESWKECQRALESLPVLVEPTQEEINIDYDYRLSLVELGLQ